MKRWRTVEDFVGALADMAMPNVFNPYRDNCAEHDLPNAAEIRQQNLRHFLAAGLAGPVDELWVGLELGRQGGRRTGLPLTDEPRLPLLGRYWKIDTLRKATRSPPMKEPTAGLVWQAVSASGKRVFFWNAFPFQCHGSGSKNNRNHTLAEAVASRAFLLWVLERLQPPTVIALGQKAQHALNLAGVNARYVRHPARGGAPQFLAQINA